MSTASGFISSQTSFSNYLLAKGRGHITGNYLNSISKAQRHLSRLKRLKRTLLNTARLLEARIDAPHYYWVMVTLTYRDSHAWDPKQVSGYIQSVRKYVQINHNIKKLHYCWVLELQKRGAPHYHVLIRLPHGIKIPKPDSSGMWWLGMSSIEKARHAIGYLAKYATKGDLNSMHLLPPAARLHGASQLDGDEVAVRRWWNLPVWVRTAIKTVSHVKPIKGGFIHNRTGAFFACPFECVFINGELLILEKTLCA